MLLKYIMYFFARRGYENRVTCKDKYIGGEKSKFSPNALGFMDGLKTNVMFHRHRVAFPPRPHSSQAAKFALLAVSLYGDVTHARMYNRLQPMQ